MAQETFGEVQITNNIEKKLCPFGGRASGTGRKIPQIGAEWAVHTRWYLQKGITFYFNIGDLDFSKGPLSHFYQ